MTPDSESTPTQDLSAVATEESPIRHRVEVRVGASRVRKAFDRAYQQLAKQVRVKGFRPGKTPRSVLERLYGASIAEELERTLVNETFADAIEQADLQPVAPPAIDASRPAQGEDFTYTATVEVKPTIELPELTGLPAKKPRVEVGDAEVEQELERLRERNAPLVEEPEETTAKTGHILGVDFVGRIDGEPFEGGTGRGVELEIGAGRFIAGFEEQLVGAKAGEDRRVEVTFPADYGSEELAGKLAVFEVHVAEVKRRQVPELDDEFAKDVGDFDTLEALRDRIRSDLFEIQENAAKAELRRTLLDSLIERTPFDLPTGLVDQRVEQQVRSAVQRFQGQIPEDTLHEQVHRWRDEWRPAAEREVRETLLLETVVRDQGIEPAEGEVEARIQSLAASQGATPDQLAQALGEEALHSLARAQVCDEKALEFLAATAKVEETTDS